METTLEKRNCFSIKVLHCDEWIFGFIGKTAMQKLFSPHTSHAINNQMLLPAKKTKTMTGSVRRMMCLNDLSREQTYL